MVIVGGGVSGLAAAVELTSRGVPVLVLEQRPAPGGRAYSFIDQTTGETIDNGQHVLIAGYRRTMRFLETIGTRHLLSVQETPSLLFHHPERGFCRFRQRGGFTPLPLLFAALSFGALGPLDKVRLIRAGFALRRAPRSQWGGMTIEQWLDQLGQSRSLKTSFWEPLAVSIMNEGIAQASAALFVRSLREAFLGDPGSAALAIPTVGLSELYAHPAVAYVQRLGGAVRCNADVTTVESDGRAVTAVVLRTGERIECAAVILAIPPQRLSALLGRLGPSAGLRDHAAFTDSPIVSVHLWFQNDPMDHELVGVIGKRIQWIFNKRRLSRDRKGGGHLSVVISAAYRYVSCSNDELVRIATDDLRSVLGSAVTEPLHAVVIREKRATFSATPRVEPLRPAQTTALANLLLAGDWTDTGYPATIEGAILSAERCVEHLFEPPDVA